MTVHKERSFSVVGPGYVCVMKFPLWIEGDTQLHLALLGIDSSWGYSNSSYTLIGIGTCQYHNLAPGNHSLPPAPGCLTQPFPSTCTRSPHATLPFHQFASRNPSLPPGRLTQPFPSTRSPHATLPFHQVASRKPSLPPGRLMQPFHQVASRNPSTRSPHATLPPGRLTQPFPPFTSPHKCLALARTCTRSANT